ncbi:MAG: hypothetical protein QXH42_03595 [Thermoplasmata archaeon]
MQHVERLVWMRIQRRSRPGPRVLRGPVAGERAIQPPSALAKAWLGLRAWGVLVVPQPVAEGWQ